MSYLRSLGGARTVFSARRLMLAACMGALVPLAIAAPSATDDVGTATQFTAALFATLLTGEAVVFALAFSAASSWPSLRSIDEHIAFREWVMIGWPAAMFTAAGLMWHQRQCATYGAFLFMLTNALGVFSFVRLFELASVGGRNRLLARTLRRALDDEGAEIGRPELDDATVTAFLGAVDEALAAQDVAALRNLVAQAAACCRACALEEAGIRLYLELLHRLGRAALLRGGADAAATTARIRELVEEMTLRSLTAAEPDALLGAAARFLGWLDVTARILAGRGVADPRAARDLTAAAIAGRLRILRVMDPDPVSPESRDELGTPLEDPLALVTWVRDFVEYGGSNVPSAFYGVHQILAGEKFLGNFYYGDSTLSALRGRLYGPSPAANPAADRSRAAFGAVADFDGLWVLVSADAIATMADMRTRTPPELADPAVARGLVDVSTLLRTFAGHRWFGDAGQAMDVLMQAVSATPPEDSLWARSQARSRLRPAFPDRAGPLGRPAAVVMAVAVRLAPLEPGEPDDELRAFLDALPGPVRVAVADLARRVLPASRSAEPESGADAATAAEATDFVVGRLAATLQATGRHLAGAAA